MITKSKHSKQGFQVLQQNLSLDARDILMCLRHNRIATLHLSQKMYLPYIRDSAFSC